MSDWYIYFAEMVLSDSEKKIQTTKNLPVVRGRNMSLIETMNCTQFSNSSVNWVLLCDVLRNVLSKVRRQ